MTAPERDPGRALLVGEIFRRNAAVVPDRPAAALGKHALTHAELNDAGNRLAWSLREHGIGHGDRVVTWADTSLDLLPLFVALAKLGAVFAPLNARLGATEAAEVGRLARGALLVTDAERSAEADTVANTCGIPKTATLPGGRAGWVLDPAVLPARDEEPTEPALCETDPHVIFFTSGSTGRPKGVVLSHRANWLRGFQGVFRDEPERTVCMFPLFHMAAFTLALAAWQTRGEIIFVASPTAPALLEAMESRRANRFYGIPLVWSRILAEDTSRFDLSSLRELDTGTSATPIELIRALKERFPGTRTRIYYGSTEVGSATTLPDADVLSKPGSVGPASPGVDLRLSEEGEILVRSPYQMCRYFDDPEATDAALAGGWFHTGDLGVLDAEGCLSVVGRKKEIIRTGGESVSPVEVEQALADAPGVAEISIVGVADPEWGEVVCAVVVPADGAKPSLAGLHAHGDGTLAGFKKPRRLFCVDALPRTAATGQVQRTLLVERIASGALEASE
ncbi:MAG: acyl--CoA ligase [Deltaproteobacteria bacterium]|nr:acyl--CoA ligase [Deltaproteobacteria bacterium]MBW2447582.1 acyl--CoA ligase [Deltaproteobacteria bacterium]